MPCCTEFPDRWKEELIQAKSRRATETLKRYASLLGERYQRRRWVGPIRAALIVADAVGSAVVRMNRRAERRRGHH